MEPTTPEVVEAARGLLGPVGVMLRIALTPWGMWQLLAILGIGAIAHLGREALAPQLTLWLRTQHGWPKWRFRLAILIIRKLRVILFAALAWALVMTMRELTWNSRSYLVALAASVATAWVVIEFLVRVIANRFLRKVLRWIAWIWATLYLLNLLVPTTRVLDSIAVSAGSFRLSALNLIQAVIVTGFLIAAARVISRMISGSLAKNAEVSPAMRVLIGKLVQMVLAIVAVMIGLKAIGLDLTGLTIFSGALGIGLGFGLQKIVSNLMSGMIILLDKSVKPGDVISLGDTFGWIDSLGARYVSVVTRDGREYLIPNEDMVTLQVVNWSHTNDFVRLDIHFAASQADDPHVVSKLAINAALTVRRVLAQRTPVCWIESFDDGAIRYILRFWINDPQGGITNVKGQVYLALWDSFRANGVTVPYPKRDLRMLPTPQPAGERGVILPPGH